jgi:hypothetical protein
MRSTSLIGRPLNCSPRHITPLLLIRTSISKIPEGHCHLLSTLFGRYTSDSRRQTGKNNLLDLGIAARSLDVFVEIMQDVKQAPSAFIHDLLIPVHILGCSHCRTQRDIFDFVGVLLAGSALQGDESTCAGWRKAFPLLVQNGLGYFGRRPVVIAWPDSERKEVVETVDRQSRS